MAGDDLEYLALKARMHPEQYESTEDFRKDYLVANFLSKWKGLNTGLDLHEVALNSFKESESRCAASNELFRMRREGRVSFPPRVEQVFHQARLKIGRVLSSFSIEDAIYGSRPGPGATYTLRGNAARGDLKQVATDVTDWCADWGAKLLSCPLRFESAFGIKPEGDFCVLPTALFRVCGNQFTTVPKDAKTNRGIAIEPTLNVELQLGAGAELRRCLRSFAGIDLDDQQVNQDLARHAYAYRFATLDLSQASDSVCLELVYELLPPDVASFLYDLRSPFTRVGDSWFQNQKWSSMGNGYTFELETLIFWALASSCGESPIGGWASVYGDDIIVDQQVAPLVVEVLHCAGFVINGSKSFLQGSFFESCGKHYYRGYDVTPVYQKELVLNRAQVLESEWFRMANRLARYEHLHPGSAGSAWKFLYRSYRSRCCMPLTKYDGTFYEGDSGYALTGRYLEAAIFDGRLRYRCANWVSSWRALGCVFIPKEVFGAAFPSFSNKLRSDAQSESRASREAYAIGGGIVGLARPDITARGELQSVRNRGSYRKRTVRFLDGLERS